MRANGTFRIGSTVGPVLPTDPQALHTAPPSPSHKLTAKLNETVHHSDPVLVAFTLTND